MTQPPGTGTLVDQLNDLRRQVAELTRRSPAMPACRVVFNSTAGLTAGVDVFAQGNWEVREDPFGWFTLGTPSYITVGLDGYYLLNYRSTITGLPTSAFAAGKVCRDPNTVANSLASDLKGATSASEGVVLHALRPRVQIAAGTKLYWASFASASGGTLQGSSFSIPTEMTVQFISSR